MLHLIRGPLVRAILGAGLVAGVVVAAAPPALAAPPAPAPFVSAGPQVLPDRYIVVVKPDAAGDAALRSSLERTVVRNGGTIVHRYSRVLDGFSAELPAKALAAVRTDPAVDYLQRVSVISGGPVTATKAAPMPARPSAQTTQLNPPAWGIDRIDQRNLPLDNSYSYETTGLGATAYTLDSGIRATHTDFGGRAADVANFVNDGNTTDCHGHGSNVGGIIGGTLYGVAKQVQIRAIRVLNCTNGGTEDSLIAGLDWLTANHGPRSVANLSLQGYGSTVNTALERTIDSGVFVVTIANNFNTDACTNNPRSPRGVVVAAIQQDDRRADFSSFGTCVDVFAPGVGIAAAGHTSDTAVSVFSGTSMAAPHVTGWIARYLESNPTATLADAKAAIISSSTKDVVIDPGPGSPNRLLYAAPTSGGVDTSPPTAPGRPVASGVTARTVNLSWPAATDNVGVTGYDVYSGTGSSQTLVATSTTTSTTVSNLTPSTTYTFSVRARDAAGNVGPASPTVTVTTLTAPTGSCKVTYQVTSQAPGQFWANVTIANTGLTAINGWRLVWNFTAGQRMVSGWSANWSQVGTEVSATNLSWNRDVAPGGSVQIGFQGSWSGSNPKPTAFTVNGVACTVG